MEQDETSLQDHRRLEPISKQVEEQSEPKPEPAKKVTESAKTKTEVKKKPEDKKTVAKPQPKKSDKVAVQVQEDSVSEQANESKLTNLQRAEAEAQRMIEMGVVDLDGTADVGLEVEEESNEQKAERQA